MTVLDFFLLVGEVALFREIYTPQTECGPSQKARGCARFLLVHSFFFFLIEWGITRIQDVYGTKDKKEAVSWA